MSRLPKISPLLLNVALISLISLISPTVLAQEAEEESDAFECTQQQADEGHPVDQCTIEGTSCTGYTYYQFAPKASEKHGKLMCVRSLCSDPISCPEGVPNPTNVPRAPTDTTSTTGVNSMNFSQAAQRLIPDTSLGLESCTTLTNLSSQVQAARTIWYGLNYVEGDCPKNILNPLGYLSNLVSHPQAGLGNNFLPASETVQPVNTNPLTGLLFGFLNFFKQIWGL